MANKRKQTDISIRNLIVKLYSQGKSFRQVRKIVGRTHSTVQKIINKFRYDGTIRNTPGRGRKKILSNTDERICRQIKINPSTSVRKLTLDASSRINKDISVETVRRTLRKEGYNGRVARTKPYISKANRQKRIEFAKTFVNFYESFWIMLYSLTRLKSIFLVGMKGSKSHSDSDPLWYGDV